MMLHKFVFLTPDDFDSILYGKTLNDKANEIFAYYKVGQEDIEEISFSDALDLDISKIIHLKVDLSDSSQKLYSASHNSSEEIVFALLLRNWATQIFNYFEMDEEEVKFAMELYNYYSTSALTCFAIHDRFESLKDGGSLFAYRDEHFIVKLVKSSGIITWHSLYDTGDGKHKWNGSVKLLPDEVFRVLKNAALFTAYLEKKLNVLQEYESLIPWLANCKNKMELISYFIFKMEDGTLS